MFIVCTAGHAQTFPNAVTLDGGVVRSDSTRKVVHLFFSGHEFAGDRETIVAVLRRHGVKASFFFTGDFYRTTAFAPLIATLRSEGHYLGAHSDKHLLYASWDRRDSTLISRATFVRDLWDNFEALRPFGVTVSEARFLLPPYEWYNREIADWCRDSGIVLVNFSPGTYSNADYTTPDMGTRYVPTDSIFDRILRYESTQPSGLNGFHLLLHIGVHPSRTDRFARRLDELIAALTHRGYRWERIDAMDRKEALPRRR
jgi:peptidoglycan/xylan/chitin deacetylase (PgdA/CDA1 family)